MRILTDTNILTRLAIAAEPMHSIVLAAVAKLEANGDILCVVPQNLFEFWAVATRPITSNGLGFTVTEVKSELDKIKRGFTLLADPPGLLEEWEMLALKYECKGRTAHDARLVAAMNLHRVKGILTFDSRDFARFGGITVVEPDSRK